MLLEWSHSSQQIYQKVVITRYKEDQADYFTPTRHFQIAIFAILDCKKKRKLLFWNKALIFLTKIYHFLNLGLVCRGVILRSLTWLDMFNITTKYCDWRWFANYALVQNKAVHRHSIQVYLPAKFSLSTNWAFLTSIM